MSASQHASVHERWAHLRFSVIGQLLAAPPPKGELRAEINKLAARTWQHPISGEPVRFAASTIERWLLRSRRERRDPVAVLRRKVRADAGVQQVSTAIREVLRAQYGAHPSWSVQLHYDNLRALADQQAALVPLPSYSSIRRLFEAQGWRKRRRLSSRDTPGAERAEARLAAREVRSYEAPYVGSLWHWDGHGGSRPVLTARGQWVTPVLVGVIDDRSRLVCHLQWYLSENAECIAHALAQAIQKRGLPRAGLSDNGAAMLAAEISEGLARLGIVHDTTLAYSPYMNGKIEVLWSRVEGRLMAMLEGVADLTLATLNEATQAWCEYEYNRAVHSETGEAPLARYLAGPEVLRPSPDSEALRQAFTRTEKRTQRHSDGTLVIASRRFEVPNRYRHLRQLYLRYAQWDLSQVHLVDERSGQILCRLYPQDKQSNARGVRRPLEPLAGAAPQSAAGAAAPRRRGHGAAAHPADGATNRYRLAAGVPAQRSTRGGSVNKKLLSLYGLKWNPFTAEVPVEAICVGARLDSFCWRVEQLVGEGGFALVTGLPGVGKSVTLRVLVDRLAGLRDARVGVLSRPQAGIADFYREMGALFGVQLHPHNRWGGAKLLRERWQEHIDASLARPVLIVDEAQEMQPPVLNELRLLASARLDSHLLLTVVLAGDSRLLQQFRSEELAPLDSRLRVRLVLERASPEELRALLAHALAKAGAPKLMTAELIATLCDHAQGNPRALMNMAGELLALAAQREARQIDEQLFFEAFAAPSAAPAKVAARRR